MELPVVDFNSGKYDLNVIKPALMPIEFVVKKNNALIFVDITLDYWFLALSFSYDKFLKAYDCSVAKGFLPYEWINSLHRLEHPALPAHSVMRTMPTVNRSGIQGGTEDRDIQRRPCLV